tara:strand:+ start:349 stop:831 length:483 start_codon:yes stop_codon:yes gene_type:complete
MIIVYIFFSFILSCFLFSISKEDAKTMLISETKLRFFAAFGFLYLLCLGFSNEKINSIKLITNNFFAMLIILSIMSLISFTSYKILGIKSLGLGDIKLSTISTLWLGLKLSFISLTISFFLSAIYSLYGKITNRFKRFHQFAFAPFLSIGIFFSWILDKI